MKKILSILFITLFIAAQLQKSFCQEVLLPLSFNPAIKNVKVETNVSLRNALSLPFIDDFSYSSNIPDQNKWGPKVRMRIRLRRICRERLEITTFGLACQLRSAYG